MSLGFLSPLVESSVWAVMLTGFDEARVYLFVIYGHHPKDASFMGRALLVPLRIIAGVPRKPSTGGMDFPVESHCLSYIFEGA